MRAEIRPGISSTVSVSAVIDAPIARVWEVLRDFNSHWAWHPAVGESAIENGEPADQVGCVRNFFLKDGNHIREQLLALSDADHVSTYCILDATLPVPASQVARLPDTTFVVVPVREAERGLLADAFAVRRVWTVRQGQLATEWLVIRRHQGAQVL